MGVENDLVVLLLMIAETLAQRRAQSVRAASLHDIGPFFRQEFSALAAGPHNRDVAGFLRIGILQRGEDEASLVRLLLRSSAVLQDDPSRFLAGIRCQPIELRIGE